MADTNAVIGAVALALVAAVSTSGCTTHVPRQEVGAHPALHTDEAGIRQVMDREEERLKTSPLLERSPELNAFARDVVCRVAGAYCDEIRVYVLNVPYFNASMAPNGAMQIWSGLLLRAENADQLAFVVAHEIGHYVERHTVERWRTAKNAMTAAMIFSVGTAVAGVPAAGQLGQLAALSTLYGFTRDQEREADRYGFETMTNAGYDGRQCAQIWRNLVDEVAHSDSDAKRKREARASIFNTHPLTAERIDALERLAQGAASSGDAPDDGYRQVVAPRLDRWLRDDLRLRDVGQSLFLIERMIASGRDLGTLYYYKGEAYRTRRGAGDDALALEAYELATTHADAPAAAWRELAQGYRAKGDQERATQAFRTYLEASPQAEDRLLIESYLSGGQS
jgi:predicted Zn-dependent protease